MKNRSDDMLEWMAQRGNRAQPFPCTYPRIPPQFRRLKNISRFLLLARLWSESTALVGLLALAVLHWAPGQPASDRAPAVCWFLSLLFLFLGFVFRLLQRTPRFYWHCPGCRGRFPYYKPARYSDALVQEECLREMEFLHIPYVQPRFCPLVLPSECPYCRKKFFQQGKGPEG